MAKRRGPKNKGRGKDSDFYRGYHAGWERVSNSYRGVTPRKSGKGKIQISNQSTEYQKGYRAGLAAAKRYYRKK